MRTCSVTLLYGAVHHLVLPTDQLLHGHTRLAREQRPGFQEQPAL